MRQCIDAGAIINRLKRIEGQVRGLMKMVEGDKTCIPATHDEKELSCGKKP